MSTLHWQERGIRSLLWACAALSVLVTLGIILVLAGETTGFFLQVNPFAFLFGTTWTPLLEPRSFGVLPLVCGTLLVTFWAALIAVPLGVAIAIFLSEYATPLMRRVLKPVLEILAGIPSVVYGYFAVTVVTPALTWMFPQTSVFNAASAAIVVAIMVLPMIATLSDDAIRAVPNSLRQAGLALGATKAEVTLSVVLRGAMSGLIAAFVLAIARAIGETMAVALAAGSTPKLTLNALESIQTMTGYIVQVSLGDTPAGTVEYRSIFAVGLLLFVMSLGMNILAHRILRRWHEVYE